MADDRSVLERQMQRVELRPFTLDGFHRRRQRKDRNRRIGSAVVALLVIGATVGGLLRAISSDTNVAEPVRPFLGRWVAVEPDGSVLHMVVRTREDEGVSITVHDDFATVCSGAASTMTGSGGVVGTDLVIPSPVYTCDDGSQPETRSGPPLEEMLRNMTFVHHAKTDTLTDTLGTTWERDHGQDPGGEQASGDWWPQSSLDEVRRAQELADAGDPRNTWQLDRGLADGGEPWGAEIFHRFIREELGWEKFSPGSTFSFYGYAGGEGHYEGVEFIRCAPGRTNPLYPKAYPEMPPEVRRCAPTIDDSRYETVRFTVDQPARLGPAGIWVVTEWKLLEPGQPGSLYEHLYPDFGQRQFEQLAPPSDAEVTSLLQAFLGARVDGAGAEEYLHVHEAEGPPSPDEEVPLMYATTGGTPYERFESERVQGPVWPTGWTEFKVRLFADDGTVVEQSFEVVRQENGRLGLVYGSQTGDFPTTENGQAVAVRYSLQGGEVTFDAPPPWSHTIDDRTSTTLGGVGRGSASQFTMFTVAADPRTGKGCEAGPAPADAEALVRSIRSNPDLEATAPVAVSVGGIDALQMDVVAPGQLEVGDCLPMVLERLTLVPDARMRVYVLDLPEGMSARILAISIIALDSEFEHVVEAAAPIVGSLAFHTG